MKKPVLFGISFLGFCTLALSVFSQVPVKEIPADYGYIVKIGDKAPQFSTTTTEGDPFSSADWKGKVVMLQFTASWCSVCRKEMPFIERDIWQKHKSDKNFILAGIDRDEPLEKVKKFKEDIRVTYPLVLDPGGAIFNLFAEKNAGVTRNVILDKKGRIVYMTRLYKEDEFAEMVKVIDTLLKN